MTELTYRARKQIAEGNFALPGRRYPIHDISHARNALAMVARHGNAGEQAAVRAAVGSKYPSLRKTSSYRPRVEIHAFKSVEGVPHVLASVDRDGIAFPGGGIDRGSALSAARKEMLEEAGYKLKGVQTFEQPRQYTMSQRWQAQSVHKRGKPFVGVKNQIVHAELGAVDKRIHGIEGDAMSGLRLIPVEQAQQMLRRQAAMASFTSGADGNWEDRAEPALRSMQSALERYGQVKQAQASCDRDYRKEYLRDHASPEAKRHRAMRNYWNRKIDTKPGQEIDHKLPLSKGGGNGRENIRVVSREANRQKGTKTAALVARIRERALR